MRLAFAFIAALLACATLARADDLDHVGWLRPLTDPTVTMSGEEALVIVGFTLRGVKIDGRGGEFPAHIGWMPFDTRNGLRVGKTMMVTSERCARDNSRACKGVQYRLFRVPAAAYSLAWTFNQQLVTHATFEANANVRINRNTQEISAAEFSDRAIVRLDAPAFRVAPGEVAYIGNLQIDFSDEKKPTVAWVVRDEATVTAIMQTSPYKDKLIVRQGIFLAGQKKE